MAKRSAVIAIVNMLGNVSSTYGSFLYPSIEGPRYVKGGAVMAAICFACASMALLTRFVLKRENKKLDKLEQQDQDVETTAGVAKINGFRYIL